MPGAARRANHSDDVEHQVLRRHARPQSALDPHLHGLRLLQKQRLRRQHMLHLAGANAEGQRPQPAMARGVAIPTNNRRAGQRKPLLGPDDMDNPLLDIGIADQPDAKLGRIAGQRRQLRRALGIGNRHRPASRIAPRRGRQIMIGHRQRQIGPPYLAPRQSQPLERLRAGHLMDKMPVDINQASAIPTPLDNMRVPDFLIQRARGVGHGWQLGIVAGAGKHEAVFRGGSEPDPKVGGSA